MEDVLQEFKIQVCKVINESNLVLSAKYYVLKDVFQEMEQVYREYIKELQKQEMSKEYEETKTFPIQTDEMSDRAKAKWLELQQIIEEDNLNENSEQNKPQKEEENLNKNLDNKSE